jgi:predicted DsbA family dithiol-disulfide isomerase
MLKVEVYSDYVCPYCFLAEENLKRAIAGQEVEVTWKPFELRPAPTPTLRPEGDYLQQVWQHSVYPMAEQLGVDIVLPKVSPQPHTHLAFEGFQYAQEQGLGNEYTHRMFTAFFQEEQDIGKPEVLAKLAEEIGLDREEFEQALAAGTYRQKHQEELVRAMQVMKIQAVPTMVIGSRIIRGLLPEEQLKQVIEQETNQAGKRLNR